MEDEDILDSELTKTIDDTSKIIVKDDFERWDIISIVLYLLITAYVTYLCFNEGTDRRIAPSVYSSCSTFLLFAILHESLRKIKVYTVWIIISIFHIWLYYRCSMFLDEETITSNSLGSLRYTIVVLVYYQICRIINIKITGLEFVTPRGNFDRRRAGFLDYVYFVIFSLFWLRFIL